MLQTVAGCSGRGSDAGGPTYHGGVGALLAERCGSCHSESGVAPFSVFDYDEVRQRASRIARVTADRSMPPWLPVAGYVDYLNDPSLSEGEIDLIARWVEAGAPRGRRPLFSGRADEGGDPGLGPPDLVLDMAEVDYLLQPSATDEYRVFVVPVPISTTRYVRAIDFRPVVDGPDAEPVERPDTTSSGVSSLDMPVHHVVLTVDPTQSSRRLDAEDPLPGYQGASPMSQARPPDGFFLGWTPGKRPSALPEGFAWRIDPGTDLVIATHMQPTTRAVEVNASIRLYLTDDPPSRQPSSLLLSSFAIDIPAGDSAYVVEASYTLPVDVEVLAVYPHAHFLAREMNLLARLPDGEERWLLRIEDWDFDWQDAYRLRDGLHLPAGSELRMRYSYDNSSANPHNPHDPPRRTTFGPRSTDEMAELTVQVVATDPADRRELERASAEHAARTLTEGARFAVDAEPRSPRARFDLGMALRRSGRLEEAVSAFRTALSLGADADPDVHVELGNALAESGAHAEALEHLRRGLELAPDDAHAHFSLGRALEVGGSSAEAERHHLRATELLPGHAGAQAGLGRVLRDTGRLGQAVGRFSTALQISPDLVPARLDLANLLAAMGRMEEAIEQYEAALDVEPDFVVARMNLASTYHVLGRLDEAASHYRRVLAVEPGNAEAHFALGNVLRTAGDSREAVEHLRSAVRLEPRAAQPMLALAWALATEPDPAIRDPGAALRLARDGTALLSPPDARALATLAAAHAASGDFGAALERGQEALDLARRGGDAALAGSIETHLALYRQERAYVVGR